MKSNSTEDRELVITRIFKAPRELVFRVWTDMEHVGKWWGPTGFTNTILEMEVREGGMWRFIMHGPDGVDYPNLIEFQEVVKPERLVFAHGSDEDPGQFQVTVIFEEENYSTKITMRMVFRSKEERDMVVEKYGAIEGNKQTMDRLEKHLLEMEKFDQEIVTRRVFPFSAVQVFKAWMEPEHLVRWWGPKGFSNTFHEFEWKIGGEWAFTMHGPDGVAYPNKSIFVDIKENQRIVFDHVSNHHFRAIVTFDSVDGNTKLSFHMIHNSKEESNRVKHYLVPANEENFDRLEHELRRMNDSVN